jgi:hypothetical protein
MDQKTVSISLTEKELMQLEAIVLDRDQDEALRFVREVIKVKTDAAQQKICGPKL